MTRDETVALFLKGREAWNKWANELLTEKKQLQETGVWAEGSDLFGEVEPQSEETRSWVGSAKIDFSRYTFVAVNIDGDQANPHHHRNVTIEKKLVLNLRDIYFRTKLFLMK